MLLHFTAIVPNDPKVMGTSSGQLVQRRPQQQPQGSWRLSGLETKLFIIQLKKMKTSQSQGCHAKNANV